MTEPKQIKLFRLNKQKKMWTKQVLDRKKDWCCAEDRQNPPP